MQKEENFVMVANKDREISISLRYEDGSCLSPWECKNYDINFLSFQSKDMKPHPFFAGDGIYINTLKYVALQKGKTELVFVRNSIQKPNEVEIKKYKITIR
jgi:hypothetical protein